MEVKLDTRIVSAVEVTQKVLEDVVIDVAILQRDCKILLADYYRRKYRRDIIVSIVTFRWWRIPAEIREYKKYERSE